MVVLDAKKRHNSQFSIAFEERLQFFLAIGGKPLHILSALHNTKDASLKATIPAGLTLEMIQVYKQNNTYLYKSITNINELHDFINKRYVT